MNQTNHQEKTAATCPLPDQPVPVSGQAAAQTQPNPPQAGDTGSAKGSPALFVDGMFSLLFLFVGWCYYHLQLTYSEYFYYGTVYFGTLVFTVLFATVVLSYLLCSGRQPTRESWFWFAVLLGLGISTALPYTPSLLDAVELPALHITACYWVLCASGQLMHLQKTSNWIFADLFRAAVVLPIENCYRLPVVLVHWITAEVRKFSTRKKVCIKKESHVLAILLGILFAGICIALVLPLLLAADAGFARLVYQLLSGLLSGIMGWLSNIFSFLGIFSFFSQIIFIIPVAFFLYGLGYGCIHTPTNHDYTKQMVHKAQTSARIVPKITVSVALFTLCAVYIVFIMVQINYLFGAFGGTLPDGFSYAEYARRGFFELCAIAAINLAILLAANIVSRIPRSENRLLRICNLCIAVLTLLLLTTAAAKMGLYIAAYGLTVKRVMVSVFLVWIAVVFVCVIVQQFRALPTMRISIFLGAVLFSLLCLLPVADSIQLYNREFVYTQQTQDVAAFDMDISAVQSIEDI